MNKDLAMPSRYFFLLIALVLFSFSRLHTQNFTKYSTWASEKHKDPGDDDKRLNWKYDDVMSLVNGDFNNDSVPELALIINDEGVLKIFTVECRGYRILNPDVNYKKAVIVNEQEGLNLESKDDNGARWDAYTEHSTNDRTPANLSYHISNSSNIRNTLAGNFYPDPFGFEEIMFLFDNGDNHDFILLENNKTSNTMSWEFNVNLKNCYSQKSIFFNEQDFVVAGNFDSDSLDEIAILQKNGNDQNKIYILSYSSGSWNLDLYQIFTDEEMDFSNVTHVVAGDFNGNNRDELAFAYMNGINHDIYVFDFHKNTFTWVYGENNRKIFDLNKATHIISGNFDGDSSKSGYGIEELAIFYDKGFPSDDINGLSAVQQVLISDHSAKEWNLNPVIYEHRLNMDFSSNITRFAFANNFDYDIMGRDDIGILYMDHDDLNDDGQRYDYNKILMWISLPDFDTENDFIMETTSTDSSTTITDKFFPLGIHHARLITGYKDASGDYADHLIIRNYEVFCGGDSVAKYSNGRLNDEQIDYLKNTFNTCIPARGQFTDGEYYNYSLDDSTDYYCYDDDESIEGLIAYIKAADSLGLKVAPCLPVTTCFNNDRCLDSGYWNFPNRIYKTYETLEEFPYFYKKIFRNSEINTANNIPFWYLGEEPSSKTKPSRFFPFYRAFNTSYCSGTLTITPDSVTNLLTNLHRTIKDTLPHIKIFDNFVSYYSFDYYSNSYDYAQHNPFPFGFYCTESDTIQLFSPEYPYVIMLKTIQSEMRKNKETSIFQVETLGYPTGNLNGNTEPCSKSIYYTPSYNQLRWLTFTPVIEGIRGLTFYDALSLFQHDTIADYTQRIIQELKNYIPIFMTKSINNYLSVNYDRHVMFEFPWGAPLGVFKSNSYSLFYDSNESIYYLFVQSFVNIDDVDFTLFLDDNIDDNVRNEVYSLYPEYFINGLYEKLNSTNDDYGNYIVFNDDLKMLDVKVYSIGGLPNVETQIDEISLKNIMVYPNPTTDFINIHLKSKSPITKIKIFSILGVKMMEADYNDKIDVSELPTGVYFIQVECGGVIVSEKFIKQ
jgi:hypothetical protein